MFRWRRRWRTYWDGCVVSGLELCEARVSWGELCYWKVSLDVEGIKTSLLGPRTWVSRPCSVFQHILFAKANTMLVYNASELMKRFDCINARASMLTW